MSSIKEHWTLESSCCPRCGEKLEDGFISGNTHALRWYNAMPPKSIYSGTALFGFPNEGLWSCFTRKWVALPSKKCLSCNIAIASIDHTGKNMEKKGIILDITAGLVVLGIFSAWQIFFQHFVGKIKYEELPMILIAYGVIAVVLDFVMIAIGVFIAMRGALRLVASKGDE
jgi:hypothetical protein